MLLKSKTASVSVSYFESSPNSDGCISSCSNSMKHFSKYEISACIRSWSETMAGPFFKAMRWK